MLGLLGVWGAAVSITATDPKALAQRSFDERLGAIHALRHCYYENAVSKHAGSTGEKAKWLRAQCAHAEADDVAVWVKWLPEIKEQIPAAAERNHEAIAEEV